MGSTLQTIPRNFQKYSFSIILFTSPPTSFIMEEEDNIECVTPFLLFRFWLLKLWDDKLLYGFMQNHRADKYNELVMDVMLSLQLMCQAQLFFITLWFQCHPPSLFTYLIMHFISAPDKISGSPCFSTIKATCPHKSFPGPGSMFRVVCRHRLTTEWSVNGKPRWWIRASPLGTKLLLMLL